MAVLTVLTVSAVVAVAVVTATPLKPNTFFVILITSLTDADLLQRERCWSKPHLEDTPWRLALVAFMQHLPSSVC